MAIVNLGTGIIPGSDAAILPRQKSGGAINTGQTVYQDPADGRWKLLSTAINTAGLTGFAVTTCAAAEQELAVQIDGTITNTAPLVVGEGYWASDTAGSVGQQSDILTGDRVYFMGAAPTPTSLRLRPLNLGVAHA